MWTIRSYCLKVHYAHSYILDKVVYMMWDDTIMRNHNSNNSTFMTLTGWLHSTMFVNWFNWQCSVVKLLIGGLWHQCKLATSISQSKTVLPYWKCETLNLYELNEDKKTSTAGKPLIFLTHLRNLNHNYLSNNTHYVVWQEKHFHEGHICSGLKNTVVATKHSPYQSTFPIKGVGRAHLSQRTR